MRFRVEMWPLLMVMALMTLTRCQGRIVGEEERSATYQQDDWSRGGVSLDVGGWLHRLHRGLSDVDHRLHELSVSAISNVASFFDDNESNEKDENEEEIKEKESDEHLDVMGDLRSRLDLLLSGVRRHRLRSDWPNLDELDALVKERIEKEQTRWATSIQDTIDAFVADDDDQGDDEAQQDADGQDPGQEEDHENESASLSVLLERLRPSMPGLSSLSSSLPSLPSLSHSAMTNMGSLLESKLQSTLATLKTRHESFLASLTNVTTLTLNDPLKEYVDRAQNQMANLTSTLQRLPTTLLEQEQELRQLQKLIKVLPQTLSIVLEANLPPLHALFTNSSFTLDELSSIHQTLVDLQRLIDKKSEDVDEKRAPTFVKMAASISERNLLLMHFVLQLMVRADEKRDKMVVLNDDDIHKLNTFLVKPTEVYEFISAATQTEDEEKPKDQLSTVN